MTALALAASYTTLLLVKALLAVRAARRAPQPGPGDAPPAVVVQPILSGDPGLGRTLEDNVQALSWLRFVWLVDADDGAAADICARVRSRHAATRIDVLVLPPPAAGVNPKLTKLEAARAGIGDDVMVVLDDDTRMPAATLSAIFAGLRGSDLATGLPAYLDDGRWPSRLLAQFVNNNAALTYLPLVNFSPPVTINGMAYAIRASALTRLGGLGPIAGCITDDLAIARHVLAAGGRISQTASPVWVQTSVSDGRHYVQLMHRWFLFALLLLRRQPRGLQAVILLLHGAPPLLLWGVLAAAVLQPSVATLGALGLLLTVRMAVLTWVQRRIYGRALHQPLLSVLSEVLQPLHAAHATLQRTIVWRTRRYRVHDDQSFDSLPA